VPTGLEKWWHMKEANRAAASLRLEEGRLPPQRGRALPGTKQSIHRGGSSDFVQDFFTTSNIAPEQHGMSLNQGALIK
jgi:hypothetical protein